MVSMPWPSGAQQRSLSCLASLPDMADRKAFNWTQQQAAAASRAKPKPKAKPKAKDADTKEG
jgi:hypothetical protein